MAAINARAPRAARPPRNNKLFETITTRTIHPKGSSALQDELDADDDREAGELGGLLEGLGTIADTDTTLRLWRIDPTTGRWLFCNTLDRKIDPNLLLNKVKEDHGGGEFGVVLYKGNRRLKQWNLNIAGEPKAAKKDTVGTSDQLLNYLLTKKDEGGGDTLKFMMMMIDQNNKSADRQMQLLMSMMQSNAGAKSDPLAIVKEVLGIAALNKPATSNLDDTLKLLQVAKELLPAGEEQNMFASAVGQLAPLLAKALEGAPARQQQIQDQTMTTAPYDAPPPQFSGAPPAGGAPITAPLSPQANGAALPYMDDPVLAVIGPDVLYMAGRGFDPAIAAEAVLDRLDQAGVDENALLLLVLRFNGWGERWVAELAALGIDLTAHAQWANDLVAELIAAQAGGAGPDDDQDDDSRRDVGGAGDAGADAKPLN